MLKPSIKREPSLRGVFDPRAARAGLFLYFYLNLYGFSSARDGEATVSDRSHVSTHACAWARAVHPDTLRYTNPLGSHRTRHHTLYAASRKPGHSE